jgi:hypothetical protein
MGVSSIRHVAPPSLSPWRPRLVEAFDGEEIHDAPR